MKKRLSMLFGAVLFVTMISCAFAGVCEELSTATALKAYLPTVGWKNYTARDADGFDDEIMISFDANGATDSDTIDVYCQCLDGAARVVCRMCDIPADADPLKVYEQINEFNFNLVNGRWLYNEDAGYVYYTQEIYQAAEEGFGAYAYAYMKTAASYVYSFYSRFTTAIE